MIIKAGQRWIAAGHVIVVTRVSKRQEWAEIIIEQQATGETWHKRQPLPFPTDWRLQ